MSESREDVMTAWLTELLAGDDRVQMEEGPSAEHLRSILPASLSQISTDSRSIEPGDVFIAIKGESFDGHSFIRSALDKGAAFVVCEKHYLPEVDKNHQGRVVAVESTIDAYLSLGGHHRMSLHDLKIIAITGSNGKTTTKDLAYLAFSALGPAYKTQHNHNNEIGVAQTLLALTENHKYAVVEMGARHVGDIARLMKYVRPHVCCLLNIGNAHLGEFGSLENLYQTKMEMYTHAPDSSVLIVPADDEDIADTAKALRQDVVTFGGGAHKGDVSVKSVTADAEGQGVITFGLYHRDPIEVVAPYYHAAIATNLSAVIAMHIALALPVTEIPAAVQEFKPSPGRFYKYHTANEILFDDSYNANPVSVGLGLASIQTIYPGKRKILVIGDMKELGTETLSAHQELSKPIKALKGVDVVYTVGHFSGKLLAHLPSEIEGCHFENVGELLRGLAARFFYEDEPVVYIKGSNSLKLSRLVEALIHRPPLAKKAPSGESA